MKRSGDPALKTASWNDIKAYWRRRKEPMCQAAICLLPGVPIRYVGRRGPDSLDVGHVVPRMFERERKTWTIAETRPEHQLCSRSHGARLRAAYVRKVVRRGKGKPFVRAQPTYVDDDW